MDSGTRSSPTRRLFSGLGAADGLPFLLFVRRVVVVGLVVLLVVVSVGSYMISNSATEMDFNPNLACLNHGRTALLEAYRYAPIV